MARPSKYTPELADNIIAGVSIGLTDKDAALAAGITEITLWRYRKRYAGFDNRLTRARAARARKWLEQLWLNAQQSDTKAITELLDRCAPEYRKTENVNVTHGGLVKHAHHNMSAFTDDEIESLAAIAERRLVEAN